MTKIAVFAGGHLTSFPRDFAVFVGVDRGSLAILRNDLPLDLAVGDFDSVTAAERQLIQEILNSEAVEYSFENVDEDSKEYTLLLTRQDQDVREVATINNEIKKYFESANFDYQEELNPDGDADIRLVIKRNDQ